MDDLRSQLLKAGLVSEEQVKRVEKATRKDRRGKKSKQLKNEHLDEQARRQRELAELQEQDRQKQRAKHEALERERQKKADAERQALESAEAARKIIQESSIAIDAEAPVSYRFVENGRMVKTVPVTEAQQRSLGHGELGIARPHANLEQYVLIPRAAALKLRAARPEKLVLLHDPGEVEDEFDGLMW